MRIPKCHHLASRRPFTRSYPSIPTRRSTILPRYLTTLAIETSCDDTAVAILSRDEDGTHKLLYNERISSDHRAFKGIEPLVAVKGHTSALGPLLKRAFDYLPAPSIFSSKNEDGTGGPRGGGKGKGTLNASDGTPRQIPDFISVTRGPGIMPNLSVGLSTAKGLALAWDVPLLGVHHMQAHALTPRLVRAINIPSPVDDEASSSQSPLTSGPEFPFLSLLVSGGHTQLVHSRSLTDHRILATTADVALGNLLDHSARDILPREILEDAEDVMYGRTLEAFAFPEGGTEEEYVAAYKPSSRRGDDLAVAETGYDWTLPLPLRQDRRLMYSFTAIGTSIKRITSVRTDIPTSERRVLAQQTMTTAFRHLADRLIIALEDTPDLASSVSTLVVAGGVACNRFLMYVLRSTLAARGYGDLRMVVPPPGLCTDNAAMIAWAGMEMFEGGWETGLDVLAINKWPMDPARGKGILGADGWVRRKGFE